jgi:N-acetylglucosaminyldiphosphoundecaprenol N-acetyl-beta-D-mannosaminyltransferase
MLQEWSPQLVAEINASGADIVMVGMGVPIQEKWVAKYASQVTAPVLITVGGYFDHVLRRVDCYPAWVHRHKLNWLYRLVKEPRRLWRRYLLGGLEFGFLVARLKWQSLNRNRGGEPWN